MKRCLTIVAVLCLVTVAASAQTDVKIFEGTWKCTGTAFASDMGPEHPTTATVTGKWILGGKWMEVHYWENKTAKNPKPVDAELIMGVNDAAKKVVAGSVDNMGGYGTSESPGWVGDTMTLTGESTYGATKTKARDIFVKKGTTTIMHTGEIEVKGAWKKTDEETCKK
jgi:hypothetical protein